MNKKQKRDLAAVMNKTVAIVATSETETELQKRLRAMSRKERRLLLNMKKRKDKKESKLEKQDTFSAKMQMNTIDKID